ncbi:amidohydrolase [Pacificimonas flava]|uniref:Amidohydrolase n=2 Tax=Pacificimonas TaxID=1960290 RepID=A0A219B388_9SPHN|nr:MULTISPECIES: amidohydrolase family protein [Pacificimonas]MBZ6377719.1 amidohydrolase family protein [Pacificimonas aurantium]OWV32603.1 amidohydrolase [Pacificimonas flava]
MSRRSMLASGLAAGLCAFASSPLAAQDFAISNAHIADGLGGEPVHGTITVRGGRISSISAGPAPAGAIDADGAWVTPGLVAAYSVLGLAEVNAVSSADDREADDSPYNAALDAADAVNPSSVALGVTRADGITRVATVPAPGNDIFGGKAAVITMAEGVADPVVVSDAFQVMALGEGGAQLAGGARTAAYARLRDAFLEARAFARNRAGYDFGRTEDALLTRADAEALVEVIEGRTPVLVSVHRASDIRRVLALKEEYPRLDMMLFGVSEGWLVADEIAAAGVPVMAVPMMNLPVSFEALASTQSNIGRMIDAGVEVAVVDIGTSTITPRLAQQAAQLVAQARIPGATGVTHAEALKAITSVPADMIGLEDAGRLAPGALADIVIWDGDPLEATSAPVRLFIGGVEQPLDTRQRRLRDRYNPSAQESALPPQYTRPR